MNLTDLLGTHDAAWMEHSGRNCAIPDEFNADETRAAAEMWFPVGIADARYATRLCGGCPTITQCFKYAIDRPELEGVWGGTTTFERVNLRAGKQKGAGRAA